MHRQAKASKQAEAPEPPKEEVLPSKDSRGKPEEEKCEDQVG